MKICIVNVTDEINRFYIPEDVDVWFWDSILRISNVGYHFSQGFTESGSLSFMVSEIDFKNIVDSFKYSEESESEPEPEETPSPAPEQEEEKKVYLSSSVVNVSCGDSHYIVSGLDVVVSYDDDYCDFEVVFYDDLDVRDFKYTVFSDSVYFLGGILYINSDPALFMDSYFAFSSVDKIFSKKFLI